MNCDHPGCGCDAVYVRSVLCRARCGVRELRACRDHADERLPACGACEGSLYEIGFREVTRR